VSLDFYGIKSAKIKELINVELPVVKVADKSTDIVFLLEDDRYLHLEFQSTYSKNDIIRFATYDLLLYERDGRQIDTVLVFSSDVKTANASLDTGTLSFSPQVVMFANFDGDATFKNLEARLESGQELTDREMLDLIFLPLMKTDTPREELAGRSVIIAQSIPDKEKRNTCIAAIYSLSSKYLDDVVLKKLLEATKMSDMVTMLVERVVTDERIEIAKKALEACVDVLIVQKITDLDIDTIQQLKDELDNEPIDEQDDE
jgi:hypothetical protein